MPAGLVPEPSHADRGQRLGDLFVLAPPPPRPDRADDGGGWLAFADEGPAQERVTAAVKLAAVVVAAGLGGGLAMWAFGSAAVQAVTRLLS